MLGLLPVGGVTWDYLQYPLGLFELGHDVYYIEDTGLWPIFQKDEGAGEAIRTLASVMKAVGMENRWAYRDEASSEWYGMNRAQVLEILKTSELFLNISCAACMRDEVMEIPYRALVDSDPMFTQIQCIQDKGLLHEQKGMASLVQAHTHHFTFGEAINHPKCRIPSTGENWHPTRQPICLSQWPQKKLPLLSSEPQFTTVMNWSAAKELCYEGESWGQKNLEFLAVIDLPMQVAPLRLGVAMSNRLAIPFPEEEMKGYGWIILDPSLCAPDWLSYRNFLQQSYGEFSVAKHTYVKAHSGWFSCRSACYLATGRPVITQDTGWSEILPNGEGLVAFKTHDEAAEALKRVAAEPERHANAARKIAEECFDSRIVLSDLLAVVTG